MRALMNRLLPLLLLTLAPLAACDSDSPTTPPTGDTLVVGRDVTTSEDTAATPEDTAATPEDTAAAPEDIATPPEDTATTPEDTATTPEDTATPSAGACDNAADLAAFETAGAIDGHVSACVSQCLTSGQLNPACYSSCVQGRTGLSTGCSGCFGQVMDCTVKNCALQCISPTSASCTTCRDEKCTPAFTACSGVTNPG